MRGRWSRKRGQRRRSSASSSATRCRWTTWPRCWPTRPKSTPRCAGMAWLGVPEPQSLCCSISIPVRASQRLLALRSVRGRRVQGLTRPQAQALGGLSPQAKTLALPDVMCSRPVPMKTSQGCPHEALAMSLWALLFAHFWGRAGTCRGYIRLAAQLTLFGAVNPCQPCHTGLCVTGLGWAHSSPDQRCAASDGAVFYPSCQGNSPPYLFLVCRDQTEAALVRTQMLRRMYGKVMYWRKLSRIQPVWHKSVR